MPIPSIILCLQFIATFPFDSVLQPMPFQQDCFAVIRRKRPDCHHDTKYLLDINEAQFQYWYTTQIFPINAYKHLKYFSVWYIFQNKFNPLNAELNPICHLLALLGAHYIFHISG